MEDIESIFSEVVRDLDYRINWRSKAFRPGRHKSKVRGSGFEFKDVVPITDSEKFDKLDMLATAQSFDGIPRVRVVEQKSNIKIVLVADLSASLAWEGLNSKRKEMAKLACVLGYSAYRSGDEFGFIGYGSDIEFSEKAVFAKSAGFNAGRLIWHSDMKSKNHKGLKDVCSLLPTERSLIFWFSDFYFPEEEIGFFLNSASPQLVMGVSFTDNAEQTIPRYGLFSVRDSETGIKKTVFMRPSVRSYMLNNIAEKEKGLSGIFSHYFSDIYFNRGEADFENFQNWLLN